MVVLKPGGGGAVGSQYVAKAKPDGHTLLLGGTGPNTIFALVQKAPTGPDQFVPVARINYSPSIFAVRADAPWKSLREVIAYAKQNPGKLSFANTGPWGAGDFPMRMVGPRHRHRVQQRALRRRRTGAPGRAGGPCRCELPVLGPALPQIGAGKIRALAVSDTKRLSQLGSVPTITEEGVDVTFTMWRSVLAPKGTPQPVVEKLEGVFRQITEDASFKALIKQLGDDIHFQGAKEFEATWRQEHESFAKVVAGAPK